MYCTNEDFNKGLVEQYVVYVLYMHQTQVSTFWAHTHIVWIAVGCVSLEEDSNCCYMYTCMCTPMAVGVVPRNTLYVLTRPVTESDYLRVPAVPPILHNVYQTSKNVATLVSLEEPSQTCLPF